MKKLIILVILTAIAFCSIGSEEQLLDLDKIEAELKTKPEDPILHYRKCQALFAKGKEQEAVDHANITITKFIKANVELAWLKLGSIKTDKYRIDVHFNMGKKERAEKKDGIIRPYSFSVWTVNDEPKLVRTIDFELAYLDGEFMSAAIGEMKDGNHLNFGTLDEKSTFETIKKKILEIIVK